VSGPDYGQGRATGIVATLLIGLVIAAAAGFAAGFVVARLIG
jgi:hypothetical protein